MKKIHILSVALVAVLAMGVVGAVSASAHEWLANGVAIGSALPSTTTGELTLGSENGLKLGIKSAVLCSGTFVGTTGPGATDEVTGVLSLTGVTVTLSAPLVCAEVSTCTTSEVAPVDLPWLTTLTTATNDLLAANGAGNPGWEVVCKTSLGTVEETCTTADQNATVENDATEKDVLGKFLKEVTGTCSIGGANTGWVESSAADGAGLISLVNGETLEAS